ncbi:META domain-containing protein [Flavobacterium subsaxonicum]|uniref:Lipoprotein n=1 Tax=Flavobacterium subsaxonicum WB 4.1-42 = DSM 21790 TaxID=1121898 RepID=A0A0A2MFY3_9FLAO|nr:hypothetical protein [Flavobacterium subsaxonicum]KGO91597.1 hypothetical protein Q766_17160 [Flavobacterium subsaxonicum WB 4.1-42 = DSM 21790]
MKNLFLILCCILVVGCASDKKESQLPAGIAPADAANVEVLKQQFLPIIEGVWVTSDYIDDLQKTGSPFKSYNKLRGIAAIAITDDNEADSLFVGISLNNHEGSSFAAYFAKGHSPNSLRTNYSDYNNPNNSFELGYKVTTKDTLLFMYRYNRAGKLISAQQYNRVGKQSENNDMGWGIEQVANKQLIAGTYIIEGVTVPLTITFNQNGTVTGFEGFKTYTVGTDFAVNDPDELPGADHIYFEETGNSNNSITYNFKIKADTLVLSHSGTHYKLVKQ